jgi:hypothetical protein
MNRYLFIIVLFFFAISAQGEEPILAGSPGHYYGDVKSSGNALKKELHEILNAHHVSQEDGADRLVDTCKTFDNHCYKHKNLGYKMARKYLFGHLHLEGDHHNNYSLVTSYCQKRFNNDFLPSDAAIGPMKIPKSTVINTEHSWPQSKFTSRFSKTMQKSDLHALFPLISKVNSIRGNHPFGEVANLKKTPCPGAFLGTDDQHSTTQFEPADEVKGNVARAIFYFSTRYDIKIDGKQEAYLRKWNKMDPVDSFEQERNEEIYLIQYVRNPFIDKPSLIDEITDF